MTRKRGQYEDVDLRFLLEKNKALERKIKSLVKENSRLKKERSRSADLEEKDLEEGLKLPEIETGNECPSCGSTSTQSFNLEIRGSKYRYIECKCGKRSRVKK